MSDWSLHTTVPPLSADEVHVWYTTISRPLPEVEAMQAVLSSWERERARKFYTAELSRQYTFGRGWLRTLLGQYEGSDPAALDIQTGPQGKPFLTGPLSFNLSHAAGRALLAITRERDIGVDVEVVRALPDAQNVARRFFSEEEYVAWLSVPESEKPRAFFNCWTRKEAFIKAIGEGLSCPLGSFAVSLRPGEPAALLHIRGNAADAATWQIRSLEPAPGYVGAVIGQGQRWQLTCLRWA